LFPQPSHLVLTPNAILQPVGALALASGIHDIGDSTIPQGREEQSTPHREQPSGAPRSRYLRELEEQIRIKHDRDASVRAAERSSDLARVQTPGHYFDRFHAGGGGTPVRDASGRAVADLRAVGRDLVTVSSPQVLRTPRRLTVPPVADATAATGAGVVIEPVHPRTAHDAHLIHRYGADSVLRTRYAATGYGEPGSVDVGVLVAENERLKETVALLQQQLAEANRRFAEMGRPCV